MLKIKVLASTISDNFFYLLHEGGDAWLIDPVDPALAVETLTEHTLILRGIINTHWHHDHVGGNAAVRAAFPECEVIVPKAEAARIEEMTGVEATRQVKRGDRVQLGDRGSALEVHELPGHTMGHVAYEIQGHLFSGDVLFGVGIGHCRSGDVGLAYRSVRQLVEEFEGSLTFYPGHDYALRNAEFAEHYNVSHDALRLYVEELKHNSPRTLQLETLARERALNPFMRTHEEDVQRALRVHEEMWAMNEAEGRSDAEVAFRVLRALRDTY